MTYQILEMFLFITALLFVATMAKLILDAHSIATRTNRQLQTLTAICLYALPVEFRETVCKLLQEEKE